jgi:hypothetical protein
MKDWSFVNLHRHGIVEQANRLHAVSLMEKCIEFWKAYSKQRFYQRELDEQIARETSRATMMK